MKIGPFFAHRFGNKTLVGLKIGHRVIVVPRIAEYGSYYKRGNYIEKVHRKPWNGPDTSPYKDYYKVFLNGRFGLYRADGKELLPCIYDKMTGCDEFGAVAVATNNGYRWGLYSIPRGFLAPVELDLMSVESVGKDGYWMVRIGGCWRLINDWGDRREDYVGMMNRDGKIIIKPVYDWIALDREGRFEATLEEQPTHYYDLEGNRLDIDGEEAEP